MTMNGGGVKKFVYNADWPAFLKRELVGFGIDRYHELWPTVPTHIKFHQLPFQEYWSIRIIQNLSDAILTMSIANLKQHTNLYSI